MMRPNRLRGDDMKNVFAATCLLLLLSPSSGARAEEIKVTRSSPQSATKGAAANFTGAVEVTSRFQAPAPARVGGGLVTFAPGARTAWHTHPLGQTLIVTEGAGRVQHWGGPVQAIGPGDVVWIPPGVKHWHGAATDKGMAHVAISESLDGKSVDWMEHVVD
jgi:quercetin dioxygenase-like cupin family protein